MKTALIFDTETTGLPIWKEPSGHEKQPHLVQLAALLVNEETQKTISSMNVIVRPDGWDIPQEVVDVHGISKPYAEAVGVPEAIALDMFMCLYFRANIRVAHNTTFDNRLIRIALKRYFPNMVTDEEWKDRERYFCTLQNAKKIMGGSSGHTLAEALKHFTGKELVGAHDAMADTLACKDIYFAMKEREALAA